MRVMRGSPHLICQHVVLRASCAVPVAIVSPIGTLCMFPTSGLVRRNRALVHQLCRDKPKAGGGTLPPEGWGHAFSSTAFELVRIRMSSISHASYHAPEPMTKLSRGTAGSCHRRHYRHVGRFTKSDEAEVFLAPLGSSLCIKQWDIPVGSQSSL